MKSKTLLTFLYCFSFVFAFAQQDEVPEPYHEIFQVVQQMPEFPGGNDSLNAFIKKNLHFTESDLKGASQTTVYVSFVVGKDGSINEVKSIGKKMKYDLGLEDEAIRVVKLMPKWKPGKQNGQAVNTRMNLPVSFKIMPEVEQENVSVPKEEESVYTFVEQMPEFPGGQTEMIRYLQKNIHYPDSARKLRQEENIFIKFVVETDGSISEITAVKTPKFPLLLEEATRVMKSMPKWKPGKQNGKPVRVNYTLPITFKLR